MKRDLISECLPAEDHFMAPAWLGLVYFAAGKSEFIKSFEKDSGLKFRFPKGIEGLIDEVTGYQEELIFKFAQWVTKNLW